LKNSLPSKNRKTFSIAGMENFKDRMMAYTSEFETFSYLTSNNFYDEKQSGSETFYHNFDVIAAFGALTTFSERGNEGKVFKGLADFHEEVNDHIFGYLGYDLKNETESLPSNNPDHLDMPGAFFFQPEVIAWIKGNNIEVQSNTEKTPDAIFKEMQMCYPLLPRRIRDEVNLQPRISKPQYLDTIEKLRNHIIEGDVYEVNFCQEFYNEDVEIDPLHLFQRLMEISPNPFSAFMRLEGKYIICSSMERFLKKQGNKLISQPIKGTIRKSKDAMEDEKLRQELYNDEKERAENVMIVDLVRNDLAKSSVPGSVKVEELFGIYPFTQVHQMISTVTSEMGDDIHWADTIKNAFPMGSMTGAPKVMAMKLIEQYELSRRGVYSGAIGYIRPEGDFDLNVVIRTFIYNGLIKYLSLHVGSAVTYDSIPEKEYDECMVKIEGMRRALGGIF
jgi:para-aminobenzoate synthetase component 1